ncbi:MAG TPA: hypothetical protein VGE18_03275 [Candidatus Paceibacterota bacterium]
MKRARNIFLSLSLFIFIVGNTTTASADTLDIFKAATGTAIGCLDPGGRLLQEAKDLFASARNGGGPTELPSAQLGGFIQGKFISPRVPTTDKESQDISNKLLRKEKCLDAAAYNVSHLQLSSFATNTLKWVNTGFAGNPLYVRNLDSYLKSIRNEELTKFLPELEGTGIFGNAIRSVITQQVTGKTDGFINTLSGAKEYPYTYQDRYCAVDYQTIAAKEYDACLKTGATIDTCSQNSRTKYEALALRNCISFEAAQYNGFMGDFTQGGWGALLNTNNNPLSALFSTTNELSRRISTQQQNVREELTRNNGFLDVKQCAEWKNDGQVGSANGAGLTGSPVCLRYETVTPGRIVMDTLSAVTSSSIRQAESADEINEVLMGFFNGLLDKLFNKGIKGMRYSAANLSTDFGGPGSNSIIGSNGQVLGGQSPSGVDSELFDITRPQQLRAIIQTQYDMFNRSRDTVQGALNVIPLLGRLDYCLPGPNQSYATGVTENFQSFTSGFKFVGISNDDVVAQPFPAVNTITDQQKIIYGGGGVFTNHLDTKADKENNIYLGLGFDFLGEPTDGDITDYFSKAYNLVIQEIGSTYNYNDVVAAFANTANTPAQQTVNRGQAVSAYRQVNTLVPYTQAAAELETTYNESNTALQGDIAELEAINIEVMQIVGTAKARYIAQRANAGSPVDLACINDPVKGYVINTNPIIPAARATSDFSPLLDKLRADSAYFESTL